MRRDKCSLLLVADWKTGRGQEVEEGFVGWLKVDSDNPSKGGVGNGTNGKMPIGGGGKEEVQEVMIKGVRVCRECWQTVSCVSFSRVREQGNNGLPDLALNSSLRRKQQMQDRLRISGFTKLYEVRMRPFSGSFAFWL